MNSSAAKFLCDLFSEGVMEHVLCGLCALAELLVHCVFMQ